MMREIFSVWPLIETCIGAFYSSLVHILTISQENKLLFGINSKMYLYGVNSNRISRSYTLSQKLTKVLAEDPYVCAMLFTGLEVYSNILCQQNQLLNMKIYIVQSYIQDLLKTCQILSLYSENLKYKNKLFFFFQD